MAAKGADALTGLWVPELSPPASTNAAAAYATRFLADLGADAVIGTVM